MAKSSMVEQMARCERCGACCRQSILEADMVDATREPALLDRGLLMDGRGKLKDEAEWCININGSPKIDCVFLEGNGCSIYPTRPRCCVATIPGSPRCTDSRRVEGKPPIPLADYFADCDW